MKVTALRNAVTLEPIRNNVLGIRMTGIKAGWEQYLLLTSDVHFDSPYCDREMYKRHLERAASMDALIFDNGDFFDAMQGRDDKRRDTAELRKELNTTAYSDGLVRESAAFLKDFAPYIAWMGEGNHESSVKLKVGTNLTDRLAERLRENHKGITHPGAYSGWLRFQFEMRQTVNTSMRVYCHHGAGGGGPMTHGILDTRRQASYLPDADVIWNGHTHTGYVMSTARLRLNNIGVEITDRIDHVRTPGYKDEWTAPSNDGYGHSFQRTKMNPPTTKGSVLVRLWHEGNEIRREFTEWKY